VRAQPVSELPDAELVRRVQGDDREAFDVLYERFARRAHGVAGALLHDRSRAEDVVQEAFLAVWRHRATYAPGRGSVAAWVLGIVRHRSIDALRSQGRHDRHLTRDADPLEHAAAGGPDVEAAAAERDDAARLRRLLAALPPEQRDVIVLAYFGQLSSTEIAAQVGAPVGTIKGRMRLGLEKLRS
jgi:RNA polymerase sigma-70 factor, ECF subfamily